MVKSQILFVVPLISAFLLLLQFFALRYLIRQNDSNVNQSWRTLYTVTNVASSNDVQVILIDPKVLERLKHNSVLDPRINSYCRILCYKQKVTTLATLGEFSSRGKLFKLKKDLEERDFSVLISGKRGRKDSGHFPDQLFHLLIFDNTADKEDCLVVHLVILHDKLNTFWYRGPLHLADDDRRILLRKGFRTNDLLLPKTSTLYRKIEIIPTIMDGLVINSAKDQWMFSNPSKDLEYIECNETIGKKFYSRYPLSLDDKAEEKNVRKKVKELVVKVVEILDRLRIQFWLSSVSLLGHYRQCNVIHDSKHLDIGIKIQHFNPDLIDSFSSNDIPLIHAFGKVNDSFELSFHGGLIKLNELSNVNEFIRLNIFFFYEESDHVWNGRTSKNENGRKLKYYYNKFNLCWTNYLNELVVRIPCPTLPYIQSNYGTNWFTPIKQWNWKSSPSNVRSNGHWPRNEWHQVMQSFLDPNLN